MEKLYPTSSQSQLGQVDGYLDMVYTQLKQTTDRITNLVLGLKLRRLEDIEKKNRFPPVEPISEEEVAKIDEELEMERNVVFSVVLKQTNSQLSHSGKTYLTGDEITAADIALFHQLANSFAMLQKDNEVIEIDEEQYPSAFKWFT